MKRHLNNSEWYGQDSSFSKTFDFPKEHKVENPTEFKKRQKLISISLRNKKTKAAKHQHKANQLKEQIQALELVRKEIKKAEKQERRTQRKAAIKIQAFVRGCLVRKALEAKERERLSGLIADLQDYSEFCWNYTGTVIQKAACKIQASFKGYVVKNHYKQVLETKRLKLQKDRVTVKQVVYFWRVFEAKQTVSALAEEKLYREAAERMRRKLCVKKVENFLKDFVKKFREKQKRAKLNQIQSRRRRGFTITSSKKEENPLSIDTKALPKISFINNGLFEYQDSARTPHAVIKEESSSLSRGNKSPFSRGNKSPFSKGSRSPYSVSQTESFEITSINPVQRTAGESFFGLTDSSINRLNYKNAKRTMPKFSRESFYFRKRLSKTPKSADLKKSYQLKKDTHYSLKTEAFTNKVNGTTNQYTPEVSFRRRKLENLSWNFTKPTESSKSQFSPLPSICNHLLSRFGLE